MSRKCDIASLDSLVDDINIILGSICVKFGQNLGNGQNTVCRAKLIKKAFILFLFLSNFSCPVATTSTNHSKLICNSLWHGYNHNICSLCITERSEHALNNIRCRMQLEVIFDFGLSVLAVEYISTYSTYLQFFLVYMIVCSWL